MRRHGVGPGGALWGTFALSICLHEVIVCASFRAVMPPYLAVLSLLQLPLAGLMRSPYSARAAAVGAPRARTHARVGAHARPLRPRAVKGKRLGNLIVWAGLVVGVTLCIVLYARAEPLLTL